jgi:tRNA pseudouridine38-40 synthase
VPPDFHARFRAKSKIYEYRIFNRREPDIFLRKHLWHIPYDLDIPQMETCLSLLPGRHDFSSFQATGSEIINPVREMMRAELDRPRKGHIYIRLQADGFLRHMVRNIVGTVVEVGRGKRDAEEFGRIFRACDRTRAGVTAPPHGLFLTTVLY